MAEPAISPDMSTVERDKTLLPQGMTEPMFSIEKGEDESTLEFQGRKITQTPLVKEVIDVPTAAAKDIERQRGRLTLPELQSQFNAIVDSPDLQSAIRANDGNAEIADLGLSEGMLTNLKNDDAFYNETLQKFIDDKQSATVAPDQPVVPFEQGLPTELFENTSPEFKDSMDEIVKKNVKIRNAMETNNPYFGLDGKRLIMSKYAVGDTWPEFVKGFKALPGDIPRMLYFPEMAIYGIKAVASGVMSERAFADVVPETFGRDMADSFAAAGDKAFLEKFSLTDGAISTMQRWYKKNFIEEYGIDEWKRQHTEGVIKIGEDGSKELVRDENGIAQRREVGLPPDVASAMITLAFDELPFVGKAVNLFGAQAGLTGSVALLATNSSKKLVARARKAREDSPETYGQMTDYEIINVLRRDDYEEATNIVKQTFFGVRDTVERIGVGPVRPFRSVGNMFRKGKVNMGTVLLERNQTLAQFDKTIDRLGKEIKDIKEGIDPLNEKNRARVGALQKEQDNFIKERAIYDKKIKKNPYLVAALRDEVLIAGAISASMEVMPDTDVFGIPADVIVGITAPMFAPVISYSVTKASWALGDSITEGLFTDVAELLQNSDMLPFIPRDILVSGNEKAMRTALKSSGFKVTDERVKSFDQFARIFRAIPETDDLGGNPRKEVENALIRYADMMKSYKTDLDGMGMEPERVAQFMKRLNLSVAHASGLAPLISYQAKRLEQVTSGKLADTKSMSELIRATADQQRVNTGIDANLKIIREMLAEHGISIGDNSQLQGFIKSLEDGALAQREGMREKQQALVLMFDQYTKNIAGLNNNIDADVVENMYRLAADLEEMSILPEGTVRGLVDEAGALDDAMINMLASVKEESAILRQTSSQMKEGEFIQNSRRHADTMLDIIHGRRKAIVSVEYKKVDTMLDGREFDLLPALQKMATLSGDLDDKPITQQLTKLGRFIKKDASAVNSVFERIAERSLIKYFGISKDTITKYVRQARQGTDNAEADPTYSVLDMALEMIESKSIPDAEIAKIFSSNFDETENLYRFFELRATKGKTDQADINRVKSEIRDVITNTYGDLSPQVMDQVKKARATHSNEIGKRTDMNVEFAWMGPALNSRLRKDAVDRPESEGNYVYTNVSRDHPEVPFIKMEKLSAELLMEADDLKAADLMKSLKAEADRVLYALGGKRLPNGRMQVDMNDAKQREAFFIYKNMVNAHVQNGVIKAIGGGQERALKALQSPGTGGRLFGKNVGEELNFGRAHRMFEIENELAVDVIPQVRRQAGDGPEIQNIDNRTTIRTIEFETIEGFVTKFDDLLLENKRFQKGYKDLEDKLDPTKGVLVLAAKNEAEDVASTIKKLELDAQTAAKADLFWDVHFGSATPDTFEFKVQQFSENAKIPEAEVRKALKYMYVEGLLKKAKKSRRIKASDGNEIEMINGEIFSDIMSDPNQKKLAKEVLGEKHFKALERMQQWVDTSIGDALDMRRGGVSGIITIDSAFSRIFNVARGMVSPLYVGTELASRTMLLYKQNLMDAALSDPEAAMAMAEILYNPKPSREIVRTFGIRMEAYLGRAVYESGQRIPTLEEIIDQRETFRTYGTIFDPIEEPTDGEIGEADEDV